jgi:hypothetical protein
MSAKQHITTHATPNSHLRQKTPARRAVTPQTPHIMVRHSAEQRYNLSQDMMAEAISQANHCFTISTHPRNQNQKINISNTDVIILL